MKHFAAIAALLLIAAPVMADSNLPPAPFANRQLDDPSQEARAVALMEELRCLVCQGQSIADSNAELAGEVRVGGEAIDPGECAMAHALADVAVPEGARCLVARPL